MGLLQVWGAGEGGRWVAAWWCGVVRWNRGGKRRTPDRTLLRRCWLFWCGKGFRGCRLCGSGCELWRGCVSDRCEKVIPGAVDVVFVAAGTVCAECCDDVVFCHGHGVRCFSAGVAERDWSLSARVAVMALSGVG